MLDRTSDYSGTRWRGRVVNVMDPKQQGRLQVRLFGLHDNQSLIPDSELPWAIPRSQWGASLLGVGSSPVGAVVGTIVDGYFADSERTILITTGTLQSAGTTKTGQIVDGSYTIDSTTNDMANAARGQDLNAALGGKNLTALAIAGSKFASLSAGVGVLSSIPTNIISTIMQLDPSNMSGSLNGAVIAISKLQAIDAFSTAAGLVDIGASSITRGLSSLMSTIGIDKTFSLLNSIDPTSLSPNVLQATNQALSNISNTFQSGTANPLTSLSAPSFNPSMLSSLSSSSSFADSSNNLMNQLSAISTISQLGSLGGIDSLASIPGGIVAGQSLLSDLAVNSFLSAAGQSLISANSIVSGLNSVINAVQLGGLNMLFGTSLSNLNQLSDIAATLVPGLYNTINGVKNIINIAESISSFGASMTVPDIADFIKDQMLGKLKSDTLNLITGDAPPVPEQSTTTDSEAATTPAPSTKPPTPRVGSADPSALISSDSGVTEAQVLVGENQQTYVDSETENLNIMNQILTQERATATDINVNFGRV
jgi:hypothetical protein